MKIIAFGGSYSKNSINKKFAVYAASLFKDVDIEILDLNDYPLPLFTIDHEKESGHPQAAKDFLAKIEEADMLIISLAENNGSYSVGFKNLFDWVSRIKVKMFEGKKCCCCQQRPDPGEDCLYWKPQWQDFQSMGQRSLERFHCRSLLKIFQRKTELPMLN